MCRMPTIWNSWQVSEMLKLSLHFTHWQLCTIKHVSKIIIIVLTEHVNADAVLGAKVVSQSEGDGEKSICDI